MAADRAAGSRAGRRPSSRSSSPPRTFWATFPGPWVAALTLVVDGALVVWLLGAKGFCTYGCPYGAIFGLAERAAPGRIRVTDACEGCGHCTAVCTSNVRVHEEVARFGQVVDPGCMKCTDCVSVCPKGALYFGFAPAHTKQKQPRPKLFFGARARRVYDFTWGEELALAAAFSGALYATRGLYGAVPLLLSVGLAVLAALALVAAWRTLRAADFELQGRALKRAGRLTPAGGLALALALGYLAFVAQSGWVNHHARAGTRLFEAGRARPEERAGLFRRASRTTARPCAWASSASPPRSTRWR